jgi:hypothetical protein
MKYLLNPITIFLAAFSIVTYFIDGWNGVGIVAISAGVSLLIVLFVKYYGTWYFKKFK